MDDTQPANEPNDQGLNKIDLSQLHANSSNRQTKKGLVFFITKRMLISEHKNCDNFQGKRMGEFKLIKTRVLIK